MKRIGIDIGGTSIKIGIVESGRIIAKTSFSVDYKNNIASEIINLIIEHIEMLLLESKVSITDIELIGVGSPGVINSKEGTIDFAANLHWEKVDIVKSLGIFGKPVKLTNDANAAGLGEVLYGAGRDFKNVIVLTIGTGIGGAIIINRKLYEGSDGKGAELGHMIIKEDGRRCSCGLYGCYEAYGSISGLIFDTKEAMKNNLNSLLWDYVKGDISKVDGLCPFECAKNGDKVALDVIDNYIKNLSVGLINVCNIFRPEAIIIGGAISNQGSNLILPIKKYLKKWNYGFLNTPAPEILCAELKNDAGIIGAAYL